MRIHEFLIGFQICILIVPMSYDNFSTFVTQQSADYIIEEANLLIMPYVFFSMSLVQN